MTSCTINATIKRGDTLGEILDRATCDGGKPDDYDPYLLARALERTIRGTGNTFNANLVNPGDNLQLTVTWENGKPRIDSLSYQSTTTHLDAQYQTKPVEGEVLLQSKAGSHIGAGADLAEHLKRAIEIAASQEQVGQDFLKSPNAQNNILSTLRAQADRLARELAKQGDGAFFTEVNGRIVAKRSMNVNFKLVYITDGKTAAIALVSNENTRPLSQLDNEANVKNAITEGHEEPLPETGSDGAENEKETKDGIVLPKLSGDWDSAELLKRILPGQIIPMQVPTQHQNQTVFLPPAITSAPKFIEELKAKMGNDFDQRVEVSTDESGARIVEVKLASTLPDFEDRFLGNKKVFPVYSTASGEALGTIFQTALEQNLQGNYLNWPSSQIYLKEWLNSQGDWFAIHFEGFELDDVFSATPPSQKVTNAELSSEEKENLDRLWVGLSHFRSFAKNYDRKLAMGDAFVAVGASSAVAGTYRAAQAALPYLQPKGSYNPMSGLSPEGLSAMKQAEGVLGKIGVTLRYDAESNLLAFSERGKVVRNILVGNSKSFLRELEDATNNLLGLHHEEALPATKPPRSPRLTSPTDLNFHLQTEVFGPHINVQVEPYSPAKGMLVHTEGKPVINFGNPQIANDFTVRWGELQGHANTRGLEIKLNPQALHRLPQAHRVIAGQSHRIVQLASPDELKIFFNSAETHLAGANDLKIGQTRIIPDNLLTIRRTGDPRIAINMNAVRPPAPHINFSPNALTIPSKFLGAKKLGGQLVLGSVFQGVLAHETESILQEVEQHFDIHLSNAVHNLALLPSLFASQFMADNVVSYILTGGKVALGASAAGFVQSLPGFYLGHYLGGMMADGLNLSPTSWARMGLESGLGMVVGVVSTEIMAATLSAAAITGIGVAAAAIVFAGPVIKEKLEAYTTKKIAEEKLAQSNVRTITLESLLSEKNNIPKEQPGWFAKIGRLAIPLVCGYGGMAVGGAIGSVVPLGGTILVGGTCMGAGAAIGEMIAQIMCDGKDYEELDWGTIVSAGSVGSVGGAVGSIAALGTKGLMLVQNPEINLMLIKAAQFLSGQGGNNILSQVAIRALNNMGMGSLSRYITYRINGQSVEAATAQACSTDALCSDVFFGELFFQGGQIGGNWWQNNRDIRFEGQHFLADDVLNNRNWSSGKLKQVSISGAEIADSNWQNTLLEDVSLHGCDATGITWPTNKTGTLTIRNSVLDSEALAHYQSRNPTHPSLEGCDLSLCQVWGENFSGYDLAGTTFPKTFKARFDNTIMDGPILEQAIENGCRVNTVDVRGQDLRGRKLSNADLSRAKLQQAKLAGAQVDGVRWPEEMKGVPLHEVRLDDEGFEHMMRVGADLRGADLSQINLRGPLTLAGMDFRGTIPPHNLRDVNLAGAWIDRAWLEAAHRDGHRVFNCRISGDLNGFDANGCDFSRAEIIGTIENSSWNGGRLPERLYGHPDGAIPQHTLVPNDPFNPETTHIKSVSGTDPFYLRGSRLKVDRDGLSYVLNNRSHFTDGRYVDASGADLSDLQFKNWDVSAGNVDAVIFDRAHLDGVTLPAKNNNLSLHETHVGGKELKHLHQYGEDISTIVAVDENLDNIKIPGARLTRANLEGASLRDGKLSNADLSQARIAGADLTRANIEGALLPENLENVMLLCTTPPSSPQKFNVTGATIDDPWIAHCIESGNSLRGTNLEFANLEIPSWQGVRLEDVTLPNLRNHPELRFTGAIADEATVSEIIRKGGMIEGLNLTEANLTRVNIGGQSLRDCQLGIEQIRQLATRAPRHIHGPSISLVGANLPEPLPAHSDWPFILSTDQAERIIQAGGYPHGAFLTELPPSMRTANADLSRVFLAGDILTNQDCRFISALPTDCRPLNFKGSTLNPRLAIEVVNNGGSISGAHIVGDLAPLSGKEFDFTEVNIHSANVGGLNISQWKMPRDLSNVDLRTAVTTADHALSEILPHGGSMRGVQIEGDVSATDFVTLTHAGADMREASIIADAHDVSFQGVPLTSNQFFTLTQEGITPHGATLLENPGVEVFGVDMTRINLPEGIPLNLAGAHVTPAQAIRAKEGGSSLLGAIIRGPVSPEQLKLLANGPRNVLPRGLNLSRAEINLPYGSPVSFKGSILNSEQINNLARANCNVRGAVITGEINPTEIVRIQGWQDFDFSMVPRISEVPFDSNVNMAGAKMPGNLALDLWHRGVSLHDVEVTFVDGRHIELLKTDIQLLQADKHSLEIKKIEMKEDNSIDPTAFPKTFRELIERLPALV